jgi:hypothetical protein
MTYMWQCNSVPVLSEMLLQLYIEISLVQWTEYVTPTNNIKLSTAQCKRLKRRHICIKKKLLLQSYFLTARKLTHFKLAGHFITLTANVCWAESSGSKLFVSPIITTEYYPLNSHFPNINQNDNIIQYNLDII